jgi:hypothetical protein
MKKLRASKKGVAEAVKAAEPVEDDEEATGSEVNIHLFGKPAWELKDFEGETLADKTLDAIKSLGEDHKAWLARAAEIAKKLKDNGWELQGTLYDIDAYKDVPLSAARKELRSLGISLKEVSLRDVEE